MPSVAHTKPPVKKEILPEGAIFVLVIVFFICIVAPYIIRSQYGDNWGRVGVGVSAPVWLLVRFFIIMQHWGSLTKRAGDNAYLATLLGFVGQLAAIVFYMWPT